LVGARFFVRNLTESDPAALRRIAAYVNMDMAASPNGIAMALNGSYAPDDVQKQSQVITNVLMERFESRGVKASATPMVSGSDFYPFMHASIPSGGIQTGAGSTKSVSQRALYGGIANAPFDPCYHQSCDTVANINQAILGETADAISYLVQKLTLQRDIASFLNSTDTSSQARKHQSIRFKHHHDIMTRRQL
jgi:Zn-dependent M28 family amino/carboxypeptidase